MLPPSKGTAESFLPRINAVGTRSHLERSRCEINCSREQNLNRFFPERALYDLSTVVVPGLYSAPTVANVERMVLQKTLRRLTSVAALTSVGVLCSAAVLMSPAHAAETSDRPLIPAAAEHSWQWPVDGSRAVISSFHAPAHDYAAGHRGIDIAAAAAGSTDAVAVRAPTGGTCLLYTSPSPRD